MKYGGLRNKYHSIFTVFIFFVFIGMRSSHDMDYSRHSPWCRMACYFVLTSIVSLTSIYLLLPRTFTSEHQHLACSMTSDCRITIVESIPDNLTYVAGSPSYLSTYEAWMQLISSASHSIDIVAFYWSLRVADTPDAHIGQDGPSDQQGEAVLQSLIHAVRDRNIKLRIINNYTEVIDNETKELVNAGADVRIINFHDLFQSGVLHTKLLLVDGIHLYVGSANMDWRALTQVKELGAVITSCPCLVDDASKLFDVYWYLGLPHTPIPSPWPSQFNTNFNAKSPMELQLNNTESRVYMSSSPSLFCPRGRTTDIDAIMDVIEKANSFVHIAIMDYMPGVIYSGTKSFWPVVDVALRKVSMEKGVKVRLLTSKWDGTDADMLKCMQSLADINGVMRADIQVKLFIVPAFTKAQAEIPFGRFNHDKFIVTESVAYIGTSNLCGDYFETTAGVGIVINQTTPGRTQDTTVQQQLADIFDRDWNSVYAHPLSEFSKHCAKS